MAQARQFLDDGYRVRIEMRMRGREKAHTSSTIYRSIMDACVAELSQFGKVVVQLKLDGPALVVELVPKRA